MTDKHAPTLRSTARDVAIVSGGICALGYYAGGSPEMTLFFAAGFAVILCVPYLLASGVV